MLMVCEVRGLPLLQIDLSDVQRRVYLQWRRRLVLRFPNRRLGLEYGLSSQGRGSEGGNLLLLGHAARVI